MDTEGKPLVVYHGTQNDFSIFDESKASESIAAQTTRVPGFYFATSSDTAKGYARRCEQGGGNIMPVFLSMKNPAVVKYGELIGGRFDRATLEANGYDGVQIQQQGLWAYIAFRSEQIKSATGNNGDFDPTNPDITK